MLALLGLAVPVAIHLWNRRPGRTVQVGSLRWLTAAANRRLRNLRLEQLLLLLLRVAVLAALALAVAGPFWQRPVPARRVQGLVLVAPEVLQPTVLPALRPTIDSLRSKGYSLRLFAPGFRTITPPAWTKPDSLAFLSAGAGNRSAGAAALPDDYWARARQAADSFPGRPLRILSGTALRHFTGPRPALPALVRWQPVPVPDSAVWLAEAALPHPDTLRLLLGHSQETGTQFRVVNVARPVQAGPLAVETLPGLRYQPTLGGATLQQPGQPAVLLKTQPLRIAVYADAGHAESGRYLRAALRAASLGIAQRVQLSAATPGTPFAEAPDWLFWLSDQPVPAAWQAQVRRGAKLWQEAAAPGIALETTLDVAEVPGTAGISVLRLDTTRLRPVPMVLWQDGTGRPVLTRQQVSKGQSFRLHTRLQPTWSGLPESPALPALLLELLRPAVNPALVPPNPHDFRQLDARQLMAVAPVGNSNTVATAQAAPAGAPAVAPPKFSTVELRQWAVLLALLLFGVERIVARRTVSRSSGL